jgi:3-hydroxybutyryl-CoA dehydratase
LLSLYYDDLVLGFTWSSRGRTITETDVINFAGVSGDYYSLHTDAEYAKTTVFGQRIAHGMLILSIATALIDPQPGRVIAFYGMERVRFTKPTFFGDTVHVEIAVTDRTDKGTDKGVVAATINVVNQRGETVIASEMKFLMAKRP